MNLWTGFSSELQFVRTILINLFLLYTDSNAHLTKWYWKSGFIYHIHLHAKAKASQNECLNFNQGNLAALKTVT